MAISFSLSQMKMDPDTRKASKNSRVGKGDRWASGRYYVVEAKRESLMPFASPRTQVFKVRASDHPKVIRRLERDGWTTRSRKIKRGGM
jgi:hypothetical protein